MQFNQARNLGRVFKGEKEEKWAKSQHLKINTIAMQCFPLYTLMRAMNRTSIDFFRYKTTVSSARERDCAQRNGYGAF